MDRSEAVGIAAGRVVLMFAMAGQAPEIDVARSKGGKDVAEWIQGAKDGVIGEDDFIVGSQVGPPDRVEAGFVAPDIKALVLTHDDLRRNGEKFLLLLDRIWPLTTTTSASRFSLRSFRKYGT
jgi:hypothetical protein